MIKPFNIQLFCVLQFIDIIFLACSCLTLVVEIPFNKAEWLVGNLIMTILHNYINYNI